MTAPFSLFLILDVWFYYFCFMAEKIPSYNQDTGTEVDLHVKKALVQGQENERARLAKDLHDGIAPLLTTLKLKVGAAEMEEEGKEDLKQMIDEIIAEIRLISTNLMPSVLLDFGVGEALRNLVRQLQTSSQLDIKYQGDLQQPTRLPQDLQLNLYRIAQEGLHNAIKHAKAREIRLSITEFEDHVSLFISDDGNGFDLKKIDKGNGLRNLQARTQLFQGSFYIDSNKEGTTIEVEIPLG